MWHKVLGIQVTLENVEFQVHLKKVKQKDFQVARLGWIADYIDPFTFLELLTSDCGNNRSNWSHPEYDRLIQLGQHSADPKKRLEAFRQAEQIMASEQPMIPHVEVFRAPQKYVCFTKPTMRLSCRSCSTPFH